MSSFLRRLFSGKKNVSTAALGDKGVDEPVGPIHNEVEYENPDLEKGRAWIGVDLDGTLAYFNGWFGFGHIGKPIPGMKARVLEWIAQGYQVKVFTARASVPEGIAPIKKWLAENGLPDLEVTCTKDFHMLELWDDRAIQVVANSGSPVLSGRWGAQPRAPLFGLERTLHGKEALKEMEEEQ